MNREIKFRAWDKSRNKWLYLFDIDQNGEVLEYDTGRCGFGEPQRFVNHDAVLQQFTGFTDKNGVDIYEGDIVEGHRFEDKKKVVIKGTVEWHQPTCTFVIRTNENVTNWLNSLYDLMVVGNIFESK